MTLNGQELKWLESHDYTTWGTHVSRSLERKQPGPHEVFSLSGACAGTLNGHVAVIVGGKEELPSENFTNVSRLDLFDLVTAKWLTGYDVHGELTNRIGHSVVTLDMKVYTFGGELIFGSGLELLQFNGDVYEISYEDKVLYCTDISPISGDGTDPNIPLVPTPSERAWHASAAVRYRDAASDPESPQTQGVLILGGENSQGAILSDIWMLVVNVAGQKPRWVQLSPTGNSPLPLVFHNAVTIGDGDKVIVVGGRQHANPLTPALNSGIHILDLVSNTWAIITAGIEDPESPVPRVLTTRCCATALALHLPIDADTGVVRRIKDGEVGEKPCEPQEVVVIFGGFSEYEAALKASSMIILEPQHSRIREVHVPTAELTSYMGHASTVRPDKRGFFLFGGVTIPEEDQLEQMFLDSTTALDFWETPACFPSEAEEEAQRQAAANPTKTKTLNNGDVYVGEMNADQTQRHGNGKCSYVNGDEYDGDWRDDQRCGQGVMRYASSQDTYAGQWEGDQRNGYGIYEYHLPDAKAQQRQRTKYEGQWVNDQKHGAGTLTFSDGTKLIGSWLDDALDTREKSCLEGYDGGQNGACRYVGEVRNGVPHGQGESHHHVSSEVYEGSWENGRRSGHGVSTLRDGSVYRGEWRNGRRNGFGVFDDVRTRAHYDGKWVGGVRCGRGVCKYANGCSYQGDWQDDSRHGTGRYSFIDSSCYDGAWFNDKFCGDGSFMLCIEDSDATARQDPDSSKN